MIDFQPMPKRFMVWDKEAQGFVKGVNGYILNWREIANLVEPTIWDCTTELDDVVERFIIIQSTNLFDKDGKEIFEGSIVKDESSGLHWLVFMEHGEVKIRRGGSVMHYGYISCPVVSCPTSLENYKDDNVVAVGHVLSNPELLEEK